MAIRKIVKIDEDKCNGCGICVPGCAEGAIQIIDGKAKLIADNLCDGIGNCLGECPLDAIEVIEREAEDFDEEAVEVHLEKMKDLKEHKAESHSCGCEGTKPKEIKREPVKHTHSEKSQGCGCQGSKPMHIKRSIKNMGRATVSNNDVEIKIKPQLSQWPVQLKLVPEIGSFYNGKELLITADCVPFAYPNYHLDLLKNKSVVIGCPKLDDIEFYVSKLTNILKLNDVTGVVVAHMEVPCCNGIVMAAVEAVRRSGKNIELKKVKITINGDKVEH